MKNKELGIYIHIPFCKHKCYYCDFVSFSSKEEIVEKYIKTVIKELKKYLENKEFMKNYKKDVRKVYLGLGISGVVICGLCFWYTSIFMCVWCVWFLCYIVGAVGLHLHHEIGRQTQQTAEIVVYQTRMQ